MFACCCRRGQLCLVLDLDHTVVNSAKFSEVVEPELAVSLQVLAERLCPTLGFCRP